MHQLPLHDLGILVTRPAHQAAALCRLLETEGAAVTRFPAIDIKPLTDGGAWAVRLGAIQDFDLIIFSSANAVRYGTALLDQGQDLPLAAIGPATERALHQAGYRVSVRPAAGFDSETLLSEPELVAIAGRRVLLVKGQGGRDLIERELIRRGARLVLAEVYRRECPSPTEAELCALASRFERREIQVITATSTEIGSNLLALATPELRRHFEAAHWVVPGARVGELLRKGGLTAPLVQAASAQDQDLVSAVVRWRSSVSGA
jgi:uroporphyrinogen-III synthase